MAGVGAAAPRAASTRSATAASAAADPLLASPWRRRERSEALTPGLIPADALAPPPPESSRPPAPPPPPDPIREVPPKHNPGGVNGDRPPRLSGGY